MFRRPDARPLEKGIGKSEGVLVADHVGNGLDLLIGRGEQFGGMTHAQERQVFDRTPPDVLQAKSPQLFRAHAGDPGDLLQGPGAPKILAHRIPGAPNPVIGRQGPGKPQHVVMNELHPVIANGGFSLAGACVFGGKSFDREFDRMGVIGAHGWRGGCGHGGAHAARFEITHPCEMPTLA